MEGLLARCITDQLTERDLLDVATVVLVVRPSSREGDGLFFGVVDQSTVDELTTIVGVQPEERKGKSASDLGQLLEDRRFAFIAHPTAEHPAGGHIHRAQGEEELPCARGPTMGHQVDLQESRPCIIVAGLIWATRSTSPGFTSASSPHALNTL